MKLLKYKDLDDFVADAYDTMSQRDVAATTGSDNKNDGGWPHL